jgi:hypothetical protein
VKAAARTISVLGAVAGVWTIAVSLWHVLWMIPLLAARGLVIGVVFAGWGWGAVREMYEDDV